MVVDHHLPLFTGQFHANPRLEKIDGDRELSAAGMAYIVAQEMGDNRDLAGLVIPGIIGDCQEFAGKNLEIFNEGVANGIIVPDWGMTLAGRDMAEKWLLATRPYLDRISGDDSAVADLLAAAQGEAGLKTDVLLSLAVLTSAPQASAEGLGMLYGDTVHLQREVIEDAHALTAVIDACGKSGHGDLAVALCLRSSAEIEQAWEATRRHHLGVIGAIKTVHPAQEGNAVYECQDATLASDIADVLARDRVHQAPVLVYARSGEDCRISARLPTGVTADLGPLVRDLAAACGGNGGGHHTRAGATIPCDRLGAFVKGWQEGACCMMQVRGLIATTHEDAPCVAASLAPDNLKGMTTTADGNRVTTVIDGTQIRSVIASVDDYLMNLAIADETTALPQHKQGKNEQRE